MSRALSRCAALLFAVASTLPSTTSQALTPPWFEGAANYFIGTDYACLSDPPSLVIDVRLKRIGWVESTPAPKGRGSRDGGNLARGCGGRRNSR